MVTDARARLFGGSLAVVLALAQFRLILMVFGNGYGRCIEAAIGVVEGRPHWRVYQGRVLSPYAIDGLASVFPSYLAAHVFFTIVVLSLAGWFAWRIGSRLGGVRAGVTALVVLHVTFGFLLAKPWLYAWDYVDVLVFLAFVDGILAERRWPWFAGLLAVGILNHEIAVFIAVWLVVDPVARWLSGKRGAIPAAPLDRVTLVVGIAGVIGSLVVVEALRRGLLVEAIGPTIFVDAPASAGDSFHFTLWDNLATVGRIFTRFDYGLPIVILVFLVGVATAGVQLARRDPRRYLGLSVTYGLLIGSLLAFGLVLETRIYVVLIPVVVLAAANLAGEHAA